MHYIKINILALSSLKFLQPVSSHFPVFKVSCLSLQITVLQGLGTGWGKELPLCMCRVEHLTVSLWNRLPCRLVWKSLLLIWLFLVCISWHLLNLGRKNKTDFFFSGWWFCWVPVLPISYNQTRPAGDGTAEVWVHLSFSLCTSSVLHSASAACANSESLLLGIRGTCTQHQDTVFG